MTSPPSLGWTTSSNLKWNVEGTSTLRYLRRTWGEMLKVFDLSGDFPSLQVSLTESSSLHQVIGLGVENTELATHFSQFVINGTVAFNFRQDASVVQPSDFFPKCVVL